MNQSKAGGIALIAVGAAFIVMASTGQAAYVTIGATFVVIGITFVARRRIPHCAK
jgi:hypothetical protein